MKKLLISTTCALALIVAAEPLTAQTASGGASGTSSSQSGGATGTDAATAGGTASGSGTGTTTDTTTGTGQGTDTGTQTGGSQTGGTQTETEGAAGTKSDAEATGSTGKAGGDDSLTTQQRSEITRTITRTEVRRTEVDFDVNIGVSVPSTVELYMVPDEVVTIVPQYRGYRYFVLADGRIVIVNPDTMMVVTIISA